jgi:hypothetical protein
MIFYVLYSAGSRDFCIVQAPDEEAALDQARKLWEEIGHTATPVIEKVRESHWAVGKKWRAHNQVWACESYISNSGFWMRSELDRRNISQRALGKTYHEVY